MNEKFGKVLSKKDLKRILDMKKFFLFIITLQFSFLVNAQMTERERIYVQTDKQLYIAGELLWMKMYTTDDEGKLMALSKVGYVELLSDSIPEVQVKLDIQNGSGMGWLELSPMLSTGYYRLIAYTRNMHNEGADVYFEKTIGILNPYIRNEETIDSADNKTVHLDISSDVRLNSNIITDQTQYGTRSRGEIRLTNLPSEDISLAVSIAGVDPLFEPSALLKEWKDKLPRNLTGTISNKYIPEYEGVIIDGRLINMETGDIEKEKTVTTLLSFPGKDIQVYGGKINKEGQVSFLTHQIAGRKELVTTAHNNYNKNYRVDILSPFVSHLPKKLPQLKIDSTWHDYLEKRSMEVQIVEAYTADSLSRVKPLPTYFNYKPYREYVLDEYTRFNRMDEIFIEFINCARIRREGNQRILNTLNERMDGFATGKTLVLLDNIPVLDHELMINYNPLLVNKISVYLGRYIFGKQIYEGIISFSTYNNNYPGITFGENTQLFDYEGTQTYRYFYAPKYNEASSSRMPDFRHTLLWEPDLNSSGEDIVIPFYTSDVPGYYRVTVEGIGKEGTIISTSHTIEVK